MLICWILVGVLAVVVLLYGLIEVHYFLRMFFTVFFARYCKKKVHVLDETIIYGVCITTDLDVLLYHMNNARYLRELDFARVDFYERTGLYREVCSQGSGVVQGAITIRYRRFIKPLTMFKITSKIIYWDETGFFMEHRFITTSDGFIRAIAICKQKLLDCDADTIIGTLLNSGIKRNGNLKASSVKPNIPPELSGWMESNEISSAMLRQTAKNTNC